MAADMTSDTLTADELAMLQDFHRDVQLSREMAILKKYTQKLSERYKTGPADTLDVDTGVITRAPKE